MFADYVLISVCLTFCVVLAGFILGIMPIPDSQKEFAKVVWGKAFDHFAINSLCALGAYSILSVAEFILA